MNYEAGKKKTRDIIWDHIFQYVHSDPYATEVYNQVWQQILILRRIPWVNFNEL